MTGVSRGAPVGHAQREVGVGIQRGALPRRQRERERRPVPQELLVENPRPLTEFAHRRQQIAREGHRCVRGRLKPIGPGVNQLFPRVDRCDL